MKSINKGYFNNIIWDTLRKFSNNLSNLTVQNLGDGYVKCIWEISSLDNFKIQFSNSCFLAIRLFDISNNRNKNNSTCIMKEIEISKSKSYITFPIPINKGVYNFELGYRKRNGDWRLIASKDLNFGYRIKKIMKRFESDNWFISTNGNRNIVFGLHETAYQLSFNNKIGGSENAYLF